ncbi:carboxypeptidase-like regulatory domain-containing protein [Lacinutrix sp.]|uniref:carboxypeptidase-like regulatory domain-containing protein n=1 Tax=Lacinutrix sp. TaxID=1937692 RepID=UPI0034524AA5
MRKLLLFATLLFVSFLFYQSKDFKITGLLVAAEDQYPFESETVFVQRVKDSSLVTYTISDKDGKFTLDNSTADQELNLFVSYVGYKTHFQKVKIDKEVKDIGTISLDI